MLNRCFWFSSTFFSPAFCSVQCFCILLCLSTTFIVRQLISRYQSRAEAWPLHRPVMCWELCLCLCVLLSVSRQSSETRYVTMLVLPRLEALSLSGCVNLFCYGAKLSREPWWKTNCVATKHFRPKSKWLTTLSQAQCPCQWWKKCLDPLLKLKHIQQYKILNYKSSIQKSTEVLTAKYTWITKSTCSVPSIIYFYCIIPLFIPLQQVATVCEWVAFYRCKYGGAANLNYKYTARLFSSVIPNQGVENLPRVTRQIWRKTWKTGFCHTNLYWEFEFEKQKSLFNILSPPSVYISPCLFLSYPKSLYFRPNSHTGTTFQPPSLPLYQSLPLCAVCFKVLLSCFN